jgi:FAD/FMN-containing dehydrogenase
MTTTLLDALVAALGRDAVLADDASRDFYANDIFWQPGIRPLAIVRPATAEQTAQAVRIATDAGIAVVPRGGGMSYSKGTLPARDAAIVVDARRLDRIVAVNSADRFITAEAGCTWAAVNEALAGTGLRTPYWGPLSGVNATVGGALSQNSAFFGSALHGTVADSVLGVTVVLADGSVVTTGSGGRRNTLPFTREGGPDMTGLFLGDNGAFGVKVAATIRLLPVPACTGYMSFGFATIQAMGEAQVAMAQERLIAEGFGIDRTKVEHSASVNRISEGLQILGAVATSGRGLLSGVKDAIGVAVAGTAFLREHAFTLHLVVERGTDAELAAVMARVTALARNHGGVTIDSSVPRVMRARPFSPVRGMLGRDGQRWVPIHAVFPLSQARLVLDANDAFFAGQRAEMERHGIVYSVMTMTTANEFFLEPAFYWQDEITPLHAASLGEDVVRPWRGRPANPTTRAAVVALRRGTQELYASLGGVSWQVARDYPYRDLLQPGLCAMLDGIKHALDPRGLMNPGALGLAT